MSDSTVGLPSELTEALHSRDARIVERWEEGPRTYLHAESPDGRFFGRTSSDPHDVETIQHEAAVRALVGTEGPLRAPQVIASGADWMLEAGMVTEGIRGRDAIDTVVAAATRLQELTLPALDSHHEAGGGGAFKRRLKLLGTGLKIRDVLTARRILAVPTLPPVTSHGDFHLGNVFYEGGALWVVDWELADRRSAGYDLMQFWATVERDEDRDLLFDRTLELVGDQHGRDLARLRYALLVRTIANKLGATREYNRDIEGGKRLLKLLPVVRTAAF